MGEPEKEEAREVKPAKVEINPALAGEHHTLAPIWGRSEERDRRVKAHAPPDGASAREDMDETHRGAE